MPLESLNSVSKVLKKGLDVQVRNFEKLKLKFPESPHSDGDFELSYALIGSVLEKLSQQDICTSGTSWRHLCIILTTFELLR